MQQALLARTGAHRYLRCCVGRVSRDPGFGVPHACVGGRLYAAPSVLLLVTGARTCATCRRVQKEAKGLETTFDTSEKPTKRHN